MGQHSYNPRALAAARGELKPRAQRSPIKLMDFGALLAMFMPKRQPRESLPPTLTRADRRRNAARAAARRLRSMSPLFPPQSGKRRPEFSSAVPGKWSAKSAA